MCERIYRFDNAQFNWTCAHEGLFDVAVSRVLGTSAINWIDLVCMPPGHSIGCHTHGTDDEEIYIVISGSGTMTVEDQQHKVRAGDVVHNPPGGTHGLFNTGSEELRLVVVGVPVVRIPGRLDVFATRSPHPEEIADTHTDTHYAETY